MKRSHYSSSCFFLFLMLSFITNSNQILAVSNLKNQMTNAQLSFFGRLTSSNGSIINLSTSGNPSISTANLASGDTIAIASGATTSSLYTIRDIMDVDSIEIATAIGTTTTSSYVIATRSAIHTVTFTPTSSTTGEKWEFLIKTTNRSGELYNDGMPDQTGFDLGGLTAADVTCPLGGTATIGTTTIPVSMINVGSTGSYISVLCSGGTASTIGVPISIVVGKTPGNKLINPSPGLGHIPGQASGSSDTYNYAIRQLDSTNAIIDTSFAKLAATESVRVTAIVDPTITFSIGTSNSTTAGVNRCGSPLSISAPNTTPTAVSFGPLVLGAPNDLAQSLHCTTNSVSGYVVQVFENHPLTMIGSSITLPDTTCNGAGCTTTLGKGWSAFTNSGFGYALEVGSTSAGATLAIGTTQYRPFGVGEAGAKTILSRTNTPADTDFIYICYRATASTVQQAGTYENSISFIATATF